MHLSKFLLSISSWSLFILASVQAASAAWPYQTFQTEPQLHPPVLVINKTGAALADGFVIFTPEGGEESAPLIMTDSGELIWNGPSESSTNLFVQSLDGKPILTHWQGSGSNLGHGYGNVSILDDTYTEIYTICPNLTLMTFDGLLSGCPLDLHESLVTSRGSILVTAVNVTTADLTSVGGPEIGWVYDDLFLEIDIKTQEILFQWNSLTAGIPINSTKLALSGAGTSQSDPFDWFHMNSVEVLGDGYLANSRHCWSSYALNSTGEILWMIDGSTGGDFSLPSGANFEWQHHARTQNVTSTSLVLHYFNDYNDNAEDPLNPSNGLVLFLDLDTRAVTLIWAYTDPADEIYSSSQGSFSPLYNNNVFIGYGNIAKMKEFGNDGDIRMTLQFGNSSSQSFRAYRQAWEATPAGYGPKVVGSQGNGWVSWNGDTRTTHWVIYTGATNSSLANLGAVNRTGFETEFSIENGTNWLQVSAFSGETFLRNSSIVAVGT